MRVTYTTGDLFAKAPSPALLTHACNCQGAWGGGIALAFKQRFPSAYTVYRNHCLTHPPQALLGTALLIKSSPLDPGNTLSTPNYVVCLFTSVGTSSRRSPPETIVDATKRALANLTTQLEGNPILRQEVGREGMVTLHMPKLNAGLFGVPWDLTETVLLASSLHSEVYVIDHE